MKSLKARQAEREERKNREARITARSAFANRDGDAGGEVQPAEADADKEEGSGGENGGGEGTGTNNKQVKTPAGWTPNA